jgi:hypothetical protein
MWQLAWPKIAVGVLIAFGALAGLSGSRLGRIQKALRAAVSPDVVLRDATAPFFKISLSLRTGLALAAVFLMTVKPDLTQSLGAVLAFELIFLGIGSLGASATSQRARTGHELEQPVR